MSSRTSDLVVVSGDWHLGEHDSNGIGALFRVVQSLRPRLLVLNGDILDCSELHKSVLGKRQALVNGRNPLHLYQEVIMARMLLDFLVSLVPETKVVFLEGNHELRLGTVGKNQAPALFELAATLPELLGLEELGIEWHPYSQPVELVPGWYLFHGTRTNIHACKSALEETCRSIVQGHSHRLKVFPKTDPDGRTIWGVEGGHLRNVAAAYTPLQRPNWQSGFVVLSPSPLGYVPHLIPVVKGTAIFPTSAVEPTPEWIAGMWQPIKQVLSLDAQRIIDATVAGGLWDLVANQARTGILPAHTRSR